jgi:hypothetical protein
MEDSSAAGLCVWFNSVYVGCVPLACHDHGFDVHGVRSGPSMACTVFVVVVVVV